MRFKGSGFIGSPVKFASLHIFDIFNGASRVQPRRRPEKFTRLGRVAGLIEKETDERPTSNIERPTSNNVFYRFEKKAEQAYFAEAATKAGSESTYRNYAVRLF